MILRYYIRRNEIQFGCKFQLSLRSLAPLELKICQKNDQKMNFLGEKWFFGEVLRPQTFSNRFDSYRWYEYQLQASFSSGVRGTKLTKMKKKLKSRFCSAPVSTKSM